MCVINYASFLVMTSSIRNKNSLKIIKLMNKAKIINKESISSILL